MKVGVDLHTYSILHSRTYTECLSRCRGDTVEAKRLTAYHMRDIYVTTDAPDRLQLEYDETYRERYW
jgi:hypothetical protein